MELKMKNKFSLKKHRSSEDETTTNEPKKKKKIRKGKKLFGSSNKVFEGENGFTYPFGYEESDAYLFMGNKKVVSVFDVLFQYGTNNPAEIGWVQMIIPREEISTGQTIFIQRQQRMAKEEEVEIIEKKLTSNLASLDNTVSGDAQQIAQNANRKNDMRLAQMLAGEYDHVVDSDVRLIIKADSPENVEKTLAELKRIYKNDGVRGVMLVRRTGKQLEEFEEMLVDVSADGLHNSDMSTVAGTRIFLPSSGFSDREGVFVGNDMQSYINRNPAIVDFEGIKNAVVFMGGVHPFVSVGGLQNGTKLENGGSAVGHVIAEANWLAGNRTHHIVLSEFDYHFEDSLVFDFSKENVSINPFEVFGTPETVQQDATANFDKSVMMMTLLSGAYGTEKEIDFMQELKSLLVDWFIKRAGGGSGMYAQDPENEPLRAQRILATNDHEGYPKPTDFLIEAKANVARRSNQGESFERDADFLYKTLDSTFTTYPNIFKRATTIPNVFRAKDRNIYYDLSKITQDKKLLGAVFMNVLAYVTNRALAGEMIVIHGLDRIDIPEQPLLPYRERIDRKNIGLVTIFEQSENKINPTSFQNFVGKLSRQDFVVLGGLTENELIGINKSWREPLPRKVSDQLLASKDGVLYFYRERDRVGALIDTHLVL